MYVKRDEGKRAIQKERKRKSEKYRKERKLWGKGFIPASLLVFCTLSHTLYKTRETDIQREIERKVRQEKENN